MYNASFLIHLLVWLLVLCVFAGIVWMVIDAIWPGNPLFKRIAVAIFGLILLLFLLQAFGLWGDGRFLR